MNLVVVGHPAFDGSDGCGRTEGCGMAEIMRRAGVSKPCVWRWQRRFMETGVHGLLRDKTRRPGKAPVLEAAVAAPVERTLAEPPGGTTH